MMSFHDPKSPLLNTNQMLEPSFWAAHPDVNDDNAATRVWAMLLNSEGIEDGNDGIRTKMEQTEIPTVTESKPQADDVVPSHRKIEAKIAVQIAGKAK